MAIQADSSSSPIPANRKSVSLETIFTDARFFGITKATPVQRAKCRIVSGAPLGELADHPDVIELVGATYTHAGGPPREVLDISAARVGKSVFAAALIVWLVLNVDTSLTSAGDVIRIPVVALTVKGTRIIMKHLIAALQSSAPMRALVVGDAKDLTPKKEIYLRAPNNRVIEVSPVPLDRAGGSGVSVYCAGIVIDEFPRMIGAEDGVRNIEHFREAVLGRLLPGAVYLATGSPWQPYGPAYDAVVKHFGKPTEALVVLRTSGPKANPTWWTPKRIAALRDAPGGETTYKTDCLAEFADGEEAVFPANAIEDAWTHPGATDAERGRPAIFADPSALRHDYWAAMVGGWVHPKEGRPWFEIYEIVSWDKKSGARGLDLIKAVGALGKRWGAKEFHWDGYEQLMLGDLVRNEGLRPVTHPWTQGRKTEAVDQLRTLLVERRVKCPPHDILKQELVRFRARASAGGAFQYVVAGGAGHGDHASCLTLAMRVELDGFIDRSPLRAVALPSPEPDLGVTFEQQSLDFYQ